ncbi:DUF6262 family protein [Plantibacter sp. 2H11-2]|uniref:DUF6262 family protein n=1 Tax=Plantibacter sp. 2H11-2 TaxID=3414431 RepID=UPI003CF0E16E
MPHDHLRKAAQDRHVSAERRAQAAVKRMTAAAKKITFAAVAREAGVSTDFLYDTPELRELILQLREHRPETQVGSTTNANGAVRALTARIAHERGVHRHEIERLRLALEQAHGENLELRRRLARYE